MCHIQVQGNCLETILINEETAKQEKCNQYGEQTIKRYKTFTSLNCIDRVNRRQCQIFGSRIKMARKEHNLEEICRQN
jgi:hypothetical protein